MLFLAAFKGHLTSKIKAAVTDCSRTQTLSSYQGDYRTTAGIRCGKQTIQGPLKAAV